MHVVGDDVLGLACFPTPGHASHHVSYLDRDGTLYAGDAAGVRIQPGHTVLPPTPPPELDVELWQRTIEEIERRDPERLALIHFGVADDPQRHLAELRLELYDWADFVRGGAGEDEFVEYVRAELRDAGERHGGLERRRCRSGSRIAGSCAGPSSTGLASGRLARNHPAVDALRDRNFRLLFAARGISYVGTYLAPIAVAFAVLDLGGSATEVGLELRRLDGRAGRDARVRRRRRRPAAAARRDDRLGHRELRRADDDGRSARRRARARVGADRAAGSRRRRRRVLLTRVVRARAARSSAPELLQQANSYLAIARYAAFPLGAAAGGTIVATVGSGTALLFDAGTYAASALLLSRLQRRVDREGRARASCASCAKAGAPSSSTRGSGCSASGSRSTS